MNRPTQSWHTRILRRRGSILMVSVVLMTVAGFSAASWLAFVTSAQRAGVRDRAQLQALYAAESGIEQVIDFMNNPTNYTGTVPAAYSANLKTSPYALTHNVHPLDYLIFEPYIVQYRLDQNGLPIDAAGDVIVDADGNLISGKEPVVTVWTYLRPDGLGGLDSKIPSFEVDLSDNSNLEMTATVNGNSVSQARVSRILVVNPDDLAAMGDAVPDSNLRVIAKIISTGQTPDGVEVTVEALVRESPNLQLASPGAIISKATATFAGQVNVHWGDLWARGKLPMKTNGQNLFPKVHEDPWFHARTEAEVVQFNNENKYADGRVQGGFGNSPITAAAGEVYYTPFLESSLHNRNNGFRGWENVHQNQTLDFPDYPYEDWKRFFQTNGLPYYFTDAGGTVYGTDRDSGSATYGQVVGKSFDEWFDIDPSDAGYWDTLDSLVFIDTIPTDANGNPGPVDGNGVPIRDATYKSREPMVSGANLATINQAGGGVHTRGAMLVAANMRFSGQGNPPGSSSIQDSDSNPYVTDPAGDEPDSSFKVSHNGLFYSYGHVINSGNRTIYGSIFAERGFSGNGAREVYYNYRLKDGSWLNLNMSRVQRLQWNVRRRPADLPVV